MIDRRGIVIMVGLAAAVVILVFVSVFVVG